MIHQIQKTKDVLSREEGIIIEQDNPLTLTISSGSHRLFIEADLLDILPKGLTSSTIDDEKFRKASSMYSFLVNKKPKILIIGVNLATMATKMKDIQNLVLAWTLTTLKQAAFENTFLRTSVLLMNLPTRIFEAYKSINRSPDVNKIFNFPRGIPVKNQKVNKILSSLFIEFSSRKSKYNWSERRVF
ncbi:MAG: hypothetical protein IBX40_09235 [Methanosarcinales archaeon]|nr:hypothetical protein [Methanosarcinales archaeon]